jgi:hypothetical protein
VVGYSMGKSPGSRARFLRIVKFDHQLCALVRVERSETRLHRVSPSVVVKAQGRRRALAEGGY